MKFSNKLKAMVLVLVAAVAAGAWMFADASRIDTGRDCDKFAVIRCGTHSAAELRQEYDSRGTSKSGGNKSSLRQSDIPAIFSAMGISRASLEGDYHHGYVDRSGNVRLGDRIVAKNARTAIRNLRGGSAISGSSTARIHSTSAMASAQAALIKLNSKGQFMFAVMKPCGNPVQATNVVPEPTPPPRPTPPKPPVPTPPKPAPKPAAACRVLDQPVVTDRTKVSMKAHATVANGATVSAYSFFITDAKGAEVFSRTVYTSALEGSTETVFGQAGTYTVKAKVHSSIGVHESADCVKQVTIPPAPTPPTPPKPQKPSVKIEKLVNGKEHAVVDVNGHFVYQIRVTNNGETDLKNLTVTDKAPEGVTFVKASEGTVIEGKMWKYTMPELKKGQTSEPITITAYVPVHLAGTIKNTACVTVPGVPGDGDDCDDATIEVKKKPNYECRELTVNQFGRDHFKFSVSYAANNGATFKKAIYKVYDAQGKEVYSSENGEFKGFGAGTYTVKAFIVVTVNGKDVEVTSAGCEKQVTIAPEMVEACNTQTGVIEKVEKGKENTPPYTKDFSKCEKIKVCDLEQKVVREVTREEAKDTKRYGAVDHEACNPKPVTPPTPVTPTPPAVTELPRTGLTDVLIGGLGLGALATASVAYVMSRRQA